MSVEFVSHLGVFLGATERAQKVGLIEAAETYMGEMRPQLLEGFTSGAFVTGILANSVARGEPEVTPFGVSIAVGSTQVDPPYALYWESGHHNLFTGKYERVPKWEPTMVRMREQLVGIVAEAIKAVDGAL